MNKYLLISVLFLNSCLVCNAQNDGSDELGAWYILSGTHTLAEKWSLYTEFQCNLYEVTSNFEQFWAITNLNYHLDRDTRVALGYGYFNGDPTFEDSLTEANTTENRIFEQFQHRTNVGRFRLQHRYRLEHRFIETPTESITRNRMRIRLRINYPIAEKWFLSVFDELFLDIREPIFNQNRLYTGAGYTLTKDIQLQAGFMKIHFTGRNYERLQLALNINTDLRKKESTKR